MSKSTADDDGSLSSPSQSTSNFPSSVISSLFNAFSTPSTPSTSSPSAAGSSTSSGETSMSSSGSPNSSGTCHSPDGPPIKKVKKKLSENQYMQAIRRADWDPMAKITTGSASNLTTARIKRDLQEFCSHPPPGIYALVRDEDITQIDVLIIGPTDTPYQGGFFHFFVNFDNEYPWKPPRVKLMTTDNAKVRFNPNFYNNGKICLSILGTWNGPQWTASQTLSSLLCSIQSLMTEEPYRNEPGHENMKANSKEALEYVDIIRHETLRVAVCDTIEGATTCPKPFIDSVIKSEFLRNTQHYQKIGSHNREVSPMKDFLGGCVGTFDFPSLLTRLDAIKSKLDANQNDSKSHDNESRVLGHSYGVDDGKRCGSSLPNNHNDLKAKVDDDDAWDFSAISDDDDDFDDEENENYDDEV